MQDDRKNEELVNLMKKQLLYGRISAIFTGLIFVVISVAIIITVPALKSTAEKTNATVEEVRASMEQLNTMSASVTKISNDLDGLVGENSEKLTEAIEKLSEVDFNGINSAVGDLRDTIGAMSEAIKRLSNFRLFG